MLNNFWNILCRKNVICRDMLKSTFYWAVKIRVIHKRSQLRTLFFSPLSCLVISPFQHWVISILIPLEEDIFNLLIFWFSFLDKKGRQNKNDQIMCPFEVASQPPQPILPISAGLNQISFTGWLAIIKSQKSLCAISVSCQILPLK